MSESASIVNGMESNAAEGKGDTSGENRPKTAKQLEKEAKKLAKLEKFKQKQEKRATVEPKEKTQVRLCYVF